VQESAETVATVHGYRLRVLSHRSAKDDERSITLRACSNSGVRRGVADDVRDLSCAKSRRGLIPSVDFGKQAASRVWSRSRCPQFA